MSRSAEPAPGGVGRSNVTDGRWAERPNSLLIDSAQPGNYIPDILVRIDDGAPDHMNLVVEVTGEKRKQKAAKVAAAETYWIPAVNNHGGFGRWSFLEVTDPWDAANLIREPLRALAALAT